MTALPALGLLAMLSGAQALWVQQEPEVRPYDPKHSMWVMEKTAPVGHSVTLTVALKLDEDRRALLEKAFWEVSDPQSEKYGNHLSLEEVTEVLAVPEERVNAVRVYFELAGASVIEVAPNRDMMIVTMPVANAEKALKTKLSVFSHSNRPDQRIVRASSTYSLPSEIAEHVVLVGELLQFPRLRLPTLRNLTGSGAWPNSCSARGCKGLITPEVLAERYKLPKSSNTQASSMAVAEFQGQQYNDKDLTAFGTSCHRDVEVDKTIGGNQPSAGIEAELDIEYIKSVAPQNSLTVIYSEQFSLLRWANEISNASNTSLVHSVSYGNDEKQQSSTQYMYTCNTAFMKAGARGISILFASGDQGVCGREGCGLALHSRFHPDFPAGSPYITSVGGTDFASSEIGDETAWALSGGGFSDTFGIPDFQKKAVAGYMASSDADLPPQRLWNNTGRGYPDIAALGGQKAPYCVNVAQQFEGVAGTSAACPVAAGVFALLNGLRAAQNKSPLGFLNPFIYQNPSAFNDVTSGVNTGGGFRKYGFKAIKGWDPATGMGTPDYEALAKVVNEGVRESASIIV
jgi:tripeptidyl-peptidase-1